MSVHPKAVPIIGPLLNSKMTFSAEDEAVPEPNPPEEEAGFTATTSPFRTFEACVCQSQIAETGGEDKERVE